MKCDDPIEILASLPSDYTESIALKNVDILQSSRGISYNTYKLNEFMNNINNGTADCVFVTVFGIDGPALTGILKFDGTTIWFCYDNSRFSGIPRDIYSFILKEIYTEIREISGLTLQYYYGKTITGKRLTIYRVILEW